MQIECIVRHDGEHEKMNVKTNDRVYNEEGYRYHKSAWLFRIWFKFEVKSRVHFDQPITELAPGHVEEKWGNSLNPEIGTEPLTEEKNTFTHYFDQAVVTMTKIQNAEDPSI